MESINSMPAKVVHVFDLRYDEFKVGRSVDTDMKIADISVSRTHSFLRVQNGKMLCEDNGSKFGTLIKIQRPIPILSSNQNSKSTLIQCGRTLLYLQLTTQRKMTYQFKSGSKKLSPDESDAYLRLRKDNLAIPCEFFQRQLVEMEFDRSRHPLVPPLQLPKNAIEEWRH